MFHYLVILLDDTSTSYCHADNPYVEPNLIPIDTLRRAFLFALKSNMNVQLVYPNYELPNVYKEAIFEIDHTNIVPAELTSDADVVVLNSIQQIFEGSPTNIIIRDYFKNIVSSYNQLASLLCKNTNVSIVIKDISSIKEPELKEYQILMNNLETFIANFIVKGKTLQLSNITDRLTLSKMNNCNAGWRSITLAPNGKLYVCPSFFYENPENHVGDLYSGITIKNQQLYKLKYAPLCSICDCFQCKRCVWLNKHLTYEVNTPSHQQCVISHYERNASKKLLDDVRKYGEYLNGINISEINYLDPIEIVKNS